MVSHYFDSHQGGIERVAKCIFCRLGRPECEVQWAAADVSTPPAERRYGSCLPLRTWNGVEKLTGLPFPMPSPRALRSLCAAVSGSDIVLLHDCLYLTNIVAFLWARMRGVPVIILQHIGMVPHRNPLLRVAMAIANAIVSRRMLSSAQQVVFISAVTKQYFGSIRFVQRPVLIFNGVNTEVFFPAYCDAKRTALRDLLGLPHENPVALFVGRFVEKKGLRVLHEMALRAPHITWAFAGAGPLDPRAWHLENVRVYPDLYDRSLAELYRASDIFVLPSTGEGFPLVLQEALASGLPVVCGSDTATADPALAPFVRGVALDLRDDEHSAVAFLNAIQEILAQGSCAQTAEQRYEFARTRYQWNQAVEQYFQIALNLTSKLKDLRISATLNSHLPSTLPGPQGAKQNRP